MKVSYEKISPPAQCAGKTSEIARVTLDGDTVVAIEPIWDKTASQLLADLEIEDARFQAAVQAKAAESAEIIGKLRAESGVKH